MKELKKNMISEAIKAEIEKCTTEKQVMKVLSKHGISIKKDYSELEGSFSVWISETERIYKPHKERYMKYQKWVKVKWTYSGIPTFFGTGLI